MRSHLGTIERWIAVRSTFILRSTFANYSIMTRPLRRTESDWWPSQAHQFSQRWIALEIHYSISARMAQRHPV